jgi:hypothetical protein
VRADRNTHTNHWPEPQIKSIGFFSDSAVYITVLEYAQEVTYFTKNELFNLLSNRVKGLLYTKWISPTAINNLIKELYEFKWIDYFLRENSQEASRYKQTDSELFSITHKGRIVCKEFHNEPSQFYENVIAELNKIYIIPGWFIQRLWNLNEKGQGQIIIPAPPKKWNPSKREWNDSEWTQELEDLILNSYNKIQHKFEGSLPIEYPTWSNSIREIWQAQTSKKIRKNTLAKDVQGFTPRKRLTFAMREASVRLLFNNVLPNGNTLDFKHWLHPLLPRTYSYWCTRLEELGLLNYTDYNPLIHGRLIYPVSTYSNKGDSSDFRVISGVTNIEGNTLKLFRPRWNSFKDIFIATLFEEYIKIYRKTKSMYISIQDLRDEVCRVLKLATYLFDTFLETLIDSSVIGKSYLRISLETDIREDQRSRTQMSRRPVYVNKKLVSLISITKA